MIQLALFSHPYPSPSESLLADIQIGTGVGVTGAGVVDGAVI